MSETMLSDVHRLSGWNESDGPIDLGLVTRVMGDRWYRGLFMQDAS